MGIKDYIIENYLTTGITRDNFIFTKCGDDFLQLARESLSKNANGVKSCCVIIGNVDEKVVGNLLEYCNDEMQRKIIAREYVLQKVLISELKDEPSCITDYQEIVRLHNDLKSGNINALFSSHGFNDVQSFISKIGRIELNFFLNDIKNKYLQQSINSYISSRTPYSVKLFSNSELCSYFDLSDNFLETPHDYLTVNINSFINKEQKIENFEK